MVEDPGLLAMFGAALGLRPPWQVTSVIFDKEAGKLEIGLDFPRGSRFACPIEGCRESACPVHDTAEKTWRHLDFFEHQAFLAARVPRVNCGEHGIHLIAVPWARPGSGFTLLMEVAMLTFAKQMPIAPLAEMAREHDTRVWRVVEHHVGASRAVLDFSGATQVERVCCDMSPAFIKGIGEHLSEQPKTEAAEEETGADTAVELVELANTTVAVQPDPGGGSSGAVSNAPGELHRPQIVFDRYHVVAKANEAVDEVRRAEAKIRPELKRSRYAWLKNESSLTTKQREALAWLTRPSMRLQTTRAARWRDDFNGFYEQPTRDEAEAYLKRWCHGAKRSRLGPVKESVRMVEAHWEGIIAWQDGQLSNGLLEGTNSLVQAAKRRARGYRSKAKMITIIYLIAGKLPLPEIHTI